MDETERQTRSAIAGHPWIMAQITVGVGARGLPLTTHIVHLDDRKIDGETLHGMTADILLERIADLIVENEKLREGIITAIDMVQSVPDV
jgi:hypothetical protein